MWELSISIRGGRSPHLREGEFLMSQDFGKRIEAISETYSAKKAAQRAFLVAWSKVMNDTILPVLKAAREHFHPGNNHLDINRNGSIALEIRSVPVKDAKKLIYSPRSFSEEIVVITRIGDEQHTESIPLDLISTDLVESHVEAFLKEALKINELGD
jgi:hypothetical protein